MIEVDEKREVGQVVTVTDRMRSVALGCYASTRRPRFVAVAMATNLK